MTTSHVTEPTRIYCLLNMFVAPIRENAMNCRLVSRWKDRGPHRGCCTQRPEGHLRKNRNPVESKSRYSRRHSLTFMLERSCLPRWMRPSLSPNWFAETFFVFLVSVLLNRYTDTTRHDTTRHDTTRHDTTRHDTTRHDTTRHDTTHTRQIRVRIGRSTTQRLS